MWASLIAQSVKNLPAVQETWVQFLGWEDTLEKEKATHSSILVWRIPWTEEPGGLQSTGSQRVGHDWATSTHLFTSRCAGETREEPGRHQAASPLQTAYGELPSEDVSTFSSHRLDPNNHLKHQTVSHTQPAGAARDGRSCPALSEGLWVSAGSVGKMVMPHVLHGHSHCAWVGYNSCSQMLLWVLALGSHDVSMGQGEWGEGMRTEVIFLCVCSCTPSIHGHTCDTCVHSMYSRLIHTWVSNVVISP